MKIDYKWIQSAIDILSYATRLKMVHPTGNATVENENGVIKIEITGDME
jgi:hypothetical protein